MRPYFSQLPLTRRLLGQYLMFGLASIMALGAGLLFVHRVLHSRHQDDAVLVLLDQTAGAIEADLRDHKGQHIQSVVDRSAVAGELQFCAVISQDGRYMHHSWHELIGAKCQTPIKASAADFIVERSRVSRAGKCHIVEYSKPLALSGKPQGFVQFGVVSLQGNGNPLTQRLLAYSPPAMLLPILLLLVGGQVLVRSVGTTSAVEQRLIQIAAASEDAGVPLLPIDGDGDVARGWNRLLERLNKPGQGPSLENRLGLALGGLRDRRADQILQALPDGVALTDRDGQVLLSNPAFLALLNAAGDAKPARCVLDLLPWDQVTDGPALRDEFATARRSVVAELQRTANIADGVLRVARYPLPEEPGHPRADVWHIRDITQQKLADDARDQFLNSATHELRMPLANIKAYSETLSLEEFDNPEERKKFLNTINTEATRLARFVDELLNINRMEAGGVSLHKQLTDVARMVKEVVDKVRPQMDQKQIAFQMSVPDKLPELQLDKEQIVASLVNLLGNAAKYTPEKGTVCFRVEIDASKLQLHVEDSGIGIAKEELPKIGTKFFRSDDPRVQDITGSGLGLAFTQEVVRLHGGQLNVTSELNKGSKFTISLPLKAS